MTFREFETAAKAAGLVAVECGAFHWQLRGALRPVNYYPSTKTVYVNGQVNAKQWGGPDLAIAVALSGPQPVATKDGVEEYRRLRRRSYQRQRFALLREDPQCYWCKKPLTKETATLDHIVPLGRGGSSRRDNICLACKGCNNNRGNGWVGALGTHKETQ